MPTGLHLRPPSAWSLGTPAGFACLPAKHAEHFSVPGTLASLVPRYAASLNTKQAQRVPPVCCQLSKQSWCPPTPIPDPHFVPSRCHTVEESKAALDQATSRLRQLEEQAAGLQAQVQGAQRQLAAWQGKVG